MRRANDDATAPVAIAREPDGGRRPTSDVEPVTADARIGIVIGAVLVAIALPLIGAGVGLSIANHTERLYQSEAVLVATDESIPPGDFAQVALALFSTDEVLEPVRSELSLSQTPAQLLAERTLSAEAVENTVAIRIVALSSDRTQAQQLADVAGASLRSVIERKGLATVKTFAANQPTAPQAPPRTLYALLGAAGGLAVAVVLAWAAWFFRGTPALRAAWASVAAE